MMRFSIARVSTVKFFVVTQLRTQIEATVKAGGDVTIIASANDELVRDDNQLGSAVDFLPVDMSRSISPLGDFVALLRLVWIFRTRKFDVVHSTTPKAGVLCAIAAKLAGVRVRVHTFTGQPWVTMSGFKRWLLKFCDKIIGSLNTRCYADSFSQKEFLVKSRVVSAGNIKVLGEGSLAGIDFRRFDVSRYDQTARDKLKAELSIPAESIIILFVGRITREKGISELLLAFKELLRGHVNTYLLCVGPMESDGHDCINCVDQDVLERVRFIGYVTEPEQYMAVSDVLCLPSYREGFGTVVMEAAAMGIPTVGSDIYGLSDAIIDNETGMLVKARSSEDLAAALHKVCCDHEFRKNLANNARTRAVSRFDSHIVCDLVIKEYRDLLRASER